MLAQKPQNQQKKIKPENIYKRLVSIAFSFIISLAFFLMIRVASVIYGLDFYNEIAVMTPFGALNILSWSGILVSYIVSVAILNNMISIDKPKLNLDITGSFVIIIAIFALISYNYCGYEFPNLFVDLDILQRFQKFSVWLTIFGYKVFSDIFFLWLVMSTSFFVLLSFSLYIDIEKVILKSLGVRRKERVVTYKKKNVLIVFILSLLIELVVLIISGFFLEKIFEMLFILLFSFFQASIMTFAYITTANIKKTYNTYLAFFIISSFMSFFIHIFIFEENILMSILVTIFVDAIIMIVITLLKGVKY